MIKRKQCTTQNDWIDAVSNINKYVSKDHIEKLVEKTAKDIRAKTEGKKAAFSWSGGKDSIALAKVCDLAGINDCVFVHCDLEYSQFMDWIYANKPEKCQMINTGQDIKWLSEHSEMLFPKDSKTAAKWFKIVQHKGQEMYYKEHGLDIIILGRRKADGNYVGKKDNIYTNSKGITRYSPLSEWTHEDILGCIYYYDLPIPPIYEWKNGYLCGTHNFASRQWTGSVENGWKEVYDIEPELVYKSADYIQSARNFLRDKEQWEDRRKI